MMGRRAKRQASQSSVRVGFVLESEERSRPLTTTTKVRGDEGRNEGRRRKRKRKREKEPWDGNQMTKYI